MVGLRARDPEAQRALFERYGPHVQRVLARVLGVDGELPDLLHDVFLEAYEGIERLSDPKALRGWLSSIAVFTARACLRRRKRRSWLRFVGWDELPEPPSTGATGEVTLALSRVYAILDGMPEDERIAFALRYIDGMELTEVAEVCGVSLATIKRKLARAQEIFQARARREPALQQWLGGGE